MHTGCHHCCIVFKYTQVSYLQLIFSMFLERLVKMCQMRPQFLLETKIQSYKLYDKSFLSLILKNVNIQSAHLVNQAIAFTLSRPH